MPLTVFKKNEVEALRLRGHECVFFVDFTGGPGFARSVALHARHVVVLDHHKTAKEELSEPPPSNMDIELDMDRSGARIALDYFEPQLTQQQRDAFLWWVAGTRPVGPKLDSEPASLLLHNRIEDGDLWRWKLAPASREFHAGLAGLKLEMDVNRNPGCFATLLGLDLADVRQSGEMPASHGFYLLAHGPAQEEEERLAGREALAEQRRTLDRLLASAFPVRPRNGDFGAFLAVLVSHEESGLRSQLGNELAELSRDRGLAPMALIAYHEPEMDPTLVKCSLRGVGAGFDTTPLSKSYGGGGHALASSFNMDRSEFETWRE